MSMSSAFMPHGMCFLWRPDVLALHVISNALIALAYFSIPVIIVLFVHGRRDVPFRAAFWMSALFIVSCGVSHVYDIVVIWHPLYWIQGGVLAVTAVASVSTALLLVPVLPRALALRSPAELERLLQRYEREHHIATTLQRASLGPLPARVGGLDVSAVYEPAVGDLEIGGDWYDVFQLPDGRVVASIGDVAGKGLAASIIMSKMRQAIRVAAQVQVAPDRILDAADRALRLEHPDVMVTAFVAIFDDTELLLTYANAGHPFPRLREPDGTLRVLEAPGLPLGLRDHEAERDARSVPLVAGSVLVLYTDGLIEATRNYAHGEALLDAALQRDGLHTASDPASILRDAVLTGEAHDDVAILTIRASDPSRGGGRWTFASDDGDAARAARTAILAHLLQAGASEDDVFAAEMVYGELIGNVARHAPGSVHVRLDWQTGSPVLHVLDQGGGFQRLPRLPTDMLAESGRGLFIIEQASTEFSVIRRPAGGSHARAVLPLKRTVPRRPLRPQQPVEERAVALEGEA